MFLAVYMFVDVLLGWLVVVFLFLLSWCVTCQKQCVGFFVSLHYCLDVSVKRRFCIVFLLQSWFALKLSPVGAASLLRSLY